MSGKNNMETNWCHLFTGTNLSRLPRNDARIVEWQLGSLRPSWWPLGRRNWWHWENLSCWWQSSCCLGQSFQLGSQEQAWPLSDMTGDGWKFCTGRWIGSLLSIPPPPLRSSGRSITSHGTCFATFWPAIFAIGPMTPICKWWICRKTNRETRVEAFSSGSCGAFCVSCSGRLSGFQSFQSTGSTGPNPPAGHVTQTSTIGGAGLTTLTSCAQDSQGRLGMVMQTSTLLGASIDDNSGSASCKVGWEGTAGGAKGPGGGTKTSITGGR